MTDVLGVIFCALFVGIPLIALLSWAESPKENDMGCKGKGKGGGKGR
jgi:hypothetical protein